MCLFLFVGGCDLVDVPVGKMPPVLTMGEPAPDFEFYPLAAPGLDLGNKRDKLSALQGRVIYLDFWASWCVPCLKSMPQLNQLSSELSGSGFEVIAVNLDENPENGIAFVQEHPVDYPVVRADDEDISGLYQLNGLPTSYLIDRQGVLRYAHQGFKDQDLPIIRKHIVALLN